MYTLPSLEFLDLDHCGFLLNLKRVSCVCTHIFDVRRDHPVFPFTVSLTSERDPHFAGADSHAFEIRKHHCFRVTGALKSFNA